MSFSPIVVWHDIECGHYGADLSLWDELAAREPGPVLDVGAGTVGCACSPRWATTSRRSTASPSCSPRSPRGRGASAWRTAVADAQDFALDRAFGLILVPMQTIQLLPERAGFFAAARAHLAPGGLLAIAIAAPLEDFGELDDLETETAALGPWRFASQPVAVRALGGATRIERRRTTVAPDGAVTEEDDAIELATVTVTGLEAEGRAAGLTPERALTIPETEDYVGAEVVMLRG